MHAYHGNILAAAAAAGSTVDPFYFNPDMVKFDPSSGCYTPGQAGYDPSSSSAQQQQHSYGRFGPFDVIRAPGSKVPTGYGGGGGGALGACYPLGQDTSSLYLTTNGAPSQQPLQTGHYMDPGLASCKQVTQGMGTVGEGGGGGGGAMGIISSYGTRNFAAMLPSQTNQPQNLPIYPWMRSIAGGK